MDDAQPGNAMRINPFFVPKRLICSVYFEKGLPVVADGQFVVVASGDLMPRFVGMHYAYGHHFFRRPRRWKGAVPGRNPDVVRRPSG